MSSYEDYSQTGVHYDSTREPVGISHIASCLDTAPVPLSQQTVLDAGCGTGNYTGALIEQVARVVAVDLNETMLRIAREKFSDHRANNRIEFHQAMISALPLSPSSVDGVVINQVLHHLEDNATEDYPAHRSVFRELHRVLRADGVLVINTCSIEQLTDGFWYYAFFPDRALAMAERHLPLDRMDGLLEAGGFDVVRRLVEPDLTLQGPSYFEPEGLFDENWRAGDSIWSTLPRHELEAVLAQAEQLMRDGDLERFMRQHDERRKEIGQFTIVHARKRSDAL